MLFVLWTWIRIGMCQLSLLGLGIAIQDLYSISIDSKWILSYLAQAIKIGFIIY